MTLPSGIRVAWRAVPDGADRRQVSRGLLAEMLPDARFVSRCAACGGEHGRVRVRGMDAAVSVSYVPGWTVVAVTSDHVRIGVDAVRADGVGLVCGGGATEGVLFARGGAGGGIAADDGPGVGAGAAHDQEGVDVEGGVGAAHHRPGGVASDADTAHDRHGSDVRGGGIRAGCDEPGVDAGFTVGVGLERVLPGGVDARSWARVEAVLKADGRGLRVDPSRVAVRMIEDGWTARVVGGAEGELPRWNRFPRPLSWVPEWRGWDVDGPLGIVAAVAVG